MIIYPSFSILSPVSLPSCLRRSRFFNTHQLAYLAVGFSVIYILAVRKYRYQRARSVETKYYRNGRPLSEMTVIEAHEVVRNLYSQLLDCPSLVCEANLF
jgi:hypothetical protein